MEVPVKTGLDRPFDGPFKVVNRVSDILFDVEIRGNVKSVSVNLLKPAYIIPEDLEARLATASGLYNHLVISEKDEILKIDTNGNSRILLTNSPHAISLDYDYENDDLYWSDLETRSIRVMDNTSDVKTVRSVTKQKSWLPISIAIESITKKLYVAEKFSDTVRVFDLKEGYQGIVIGTGLIGIRDVELDPYAGYLFVLDEFQIIRTELDGANRGVIYARSNLSNDVLEHFSSPDGFRNEKKKVFQISKTRQSLSISDITVNPKLKRIFWVNTLHQRIESSGYYGEEKMIYFSGKIDIGDTISEASISFLNNTLYWANDLNEKLMKIKKRAGRAIMRNVRFRSLKAIDCTSHRKISNPCAKNNGGCQHLCLLSTTTKSRASCGCKIGYELSQDGKSCDAMQDYLLLSQEDSIRGLSLSKPGEPFTDALNPSRFNLGSAVSIDYDSNNADIFYSSLYPKDQLYQVHQINGYEKVLQPDLHSKNVGHFAYDWASKNLYYFTYYYAGPATLNVMNTANPTHSKILIDSVDGMVSGIVIHPNRGYIYFALTSVGNGNISRMAVDGTGLIELVNLTYPQYKQASFDGLTIDYDEDRLYWVESQSMNGIEWLVRVRNSDLLGQDIQETFFPNLRISKPTAIDVHGSWVYLLLEKKLLRLNKKRPYDSMQTILETTSPSTLSGLKVHSPSTRILADDHPCTAMSRYRSGCQKFCFAVPRNLNIEDKSLKAVCGCSYGQKLAKDGRSCEDNQMFEPPFKPCLEDSYNCERQTVEGCMPDSTKTLHESKSTGSGHHFSYKLPEEWSREFPSCGGHRQSPINIDSGKSLRRKFPPFNFFEYDLIPESMEIVNNGHTAKLKVTWPKEAAPSIYGGPLKDFYRFAEMHFHWGENDNAGSEHRIDNKSYPLEIHLVHFKRSYETLDEALKYEDGVAVVGYFMSVDQDAKQGWSEGLERMMLSISTAGGTPEPGQTLPINPFPVSLFNLDSPVDGYDTYQGSLTTPPCTESVTWFLSRGIKHITSAELDMFRKLQLDNQDSHNYRPLQPLNDRPIYYIDRIL
ncbi:hypothetical protein QAD02_006438 [Eretmocerus hayati]|uniref:Uncharacterized protein n=1 Tax=Eretmocerus hayati TaxID=131215 RepID=A0ACC2N191_9HYME|nr:hypothetical protein QAD02_006438 [Eretmocerus hayati]